MFCNNPVQGMPCQFMRVPTEGCELSSCKQVCDVVAAHETHLCEQTMAVPTHQRPSGMALMQAWPRTMVWAQAILLLQPRQQQLQCLPVL